MATKKEKVVEFDQRRANYKATFLNSASGQDVLEDLEKSYYKYTTFRPNPYEAAYNEGQRSVVIAIKLLIEADVEMQIESQDTEENE